MIYINIYLLNLDNNNDNIFSDFFAKNEDIEYIKNKLDGGIYIDKWESPIIDVDTKKPLMDIIRFWGYCNTLAINKKTKTILEKNFNNLQFLPIKLNNYDNNEYFIVNIIGYVNGLDTINSQVRKIDNKYIIDIYKYVFNTNVQKYDIFKLKINNKIRTTDIFVNDKFKNIIEQNQLTGLTFKKVFEF